MKTWRVGIVGGGPGGLMTAHALQKLANCPLEITIFEASSRLGGKILTPQFDSHPVAYEAGAAEFYDYSQFDEDTLKLLIQEMGLPIRPMGGPAVVMNNRILANIDDIRDDLGPEAADALLEFDRLSKDRMTPQEFFYANDHDVSMLPVKHEGFDTLLKEVPDNSAQRYIKNLIHSDLAAEPNQTNVPYGLQNYLMNDPAYMAIYGIDGGNERLTEALSQRIAADFRMQHRVATVAKSANEQLRVTSKSQDAINDDNFDNDDFDFVVVALPLSHFNSVEYTDDRLSGRMKEHFDYYNYPAHYLRVTILFEKPFWREAFSDSYWMLESFGGCCLYDESSRDASCEHGVLGWLLGGDEAKEMSSMTDDQLVAAALDSLPAFLEHGKGDFVEGRVHRWVGAVNAMPGGVAPKNLDQRHQPEPISHPRLFVVGDYLFDSTLNGVLDSANYVAAWIAAEIADS